MKIGDKHWSYPGQTVVECVSPYTVWVCVSCVGVEEILCGVTLTRRESSLGFNPPRWNLLVKAHLTTLIRDFLISWELVTPSTVSTLSTTIKTRRRGCFVRLRLCLSITRSQQWWFGRFEWSRGRCSGRLLTRSWGHKLLVDTVSRRWRWGRNRGVD